MRFVGELYKVELLREKHVQTVRIRRRFGLGFFFLPWCLLFFFVVLDFPFFLFWEGGGSGEFFCFCLFFVFWFVSRLYMSRRGKGESKEAGTRGGGERPMQQARQ